MSQSEVEERLQMMLAEIMGVEPATVDRSAPLFRGGLELDSLSAVQFLAEIEKEYGIDVAEKDLSLACMESLARLAAFVAKHTGGS